MPIADYSGKWRSVCEQAVCYSHIGKRLTHEDNYLINGQYIPSATQQRMVDCRYCFCTDDSMSKVKLFAISDGMGGHSAGEVASRICVERLADAEKDLQRYGHIKEAVVCIQGLIAQINHDVCELSHKHDALNGMGATLVLLVICGKDYAILNVGDSRAYHFDGRTLIQITRDHTEGQRMLDLGLLTRKELADFPARKHLNRYVGYEQGGYVLHADEYYPIFKSGVVILCSDGISDFISDTRISEILCSENNLVIAGKQLIDEAVTAHNSDNATVVLIPLGR